MKILLYFHPMDISGNKEVSSHFQMESYFFLKAFLSINPFTQLSCFFFPQSIYCLLHI